jgi:integration host factor subunit beta
MTKNTLIDQVSEATQSTKKDAELVVDVVLNSIADALAKGEKVDLRGFGSFQVAGKKERQGRNPRTGETMTIPARNVALFKPSKELAVRVNGTGQDTDSDVAQPSEGSTKVHGDKINTLGLPAHGLVFLGERVHGGEQYVLRRLRYVRTSSQLATIAVSQTAVVVPFGVPQFMATTA